VLHLLEIAAQEMEIRPPFAGVRQTMFSQVTPAHSDFRHSWFILNKEAYGLSPMRHGLERSPNRKVSFKSRIG
jgi:hypothetical protein